MKLKKRYPNRRIARAARARLLSASLGKYRLVTCRTGKHIYAQIISPDARVLVSASTVEKEIRGTIKNGGNTEAARLIGLRLAKKAKDLGIEEKLAFDRGGRSYDGRIKVLADSAREGGLLF